MLGIIAHIFLDPALNSCIFRSIPRPRRVGTAKELGVTNNISRVLHQVVKQVFHQIFYFCNHKTKTVTASPAILTLVPPYLLKEANKICKMIDRL